MKARFLGAALAVLAFAPAPAGARMTSGMYGPYAMTREATGTSWQPDSTPHEGLHLMRGDWMMMAHGSAYGIYDRQSGPRGGEKAFSASMLMLMARRSLGDGALGLRAMASLDPAMGKGGYPLLLQTGETADGRTALIDRQHPHDLFMELAASYSRPVAENLSAFAYAGLPGEPALGPPAFMHRFSAQDNPAAPITHHWLDSTHITYGVATLGLIRGDWKWESSAFHGREPDQYRWDLEAPKFDSFSTRLSYNPSRDWSLQVSYGRIVSPEALEPSVDQDRLTASASWNWRLADSPGQTTLAFGRNDNQPGHRLNAYLLESAVRIARTHTIFARAERVDKDELFDSGPRQGNVFTVNKLGAGYLYDFARWGRTQWGVGASGDVLLIPASLKPAYGSTPTSFMIFARVKII